MHFAIAPNIRDRDRITQLRGIKTHKSFAMLAHDSPSLLEALPGPFRVTLATASRVSRLRKGRDIQSEEAALFARPSRSMAAGAISLVALLRDARKSALLSTRLMNGVTGR